MPLINVFAQPGVFDIQYGNETLVLVALRRSLEVKFSGKSLVIPELKQMTISEKRLRDQAPAIKKLYIQNCLKNFLILLLNNPINGLKQIKMMIKSSLMIFARKSIRKSAIEV